MTPTDQLRSDHRHRPQLYRATVTTGAATEQHLGELLDRARAHYLDAARYADRPTVWSCAVAAGHALLEAAAVTARNGAPMHEAHGLVLGLYQHRHDSTPWDDHGTPPHLPAQPTRWDTP